MRRVVVNRSRLNSEVLHLPGHDDSLPTTPISALLDTHDVPDGFAFLIEDDGTFTGVASVNQYLHEAWTQRAYPLRTITTTHLYVLWRALRFLRARRHQQDSAGPEPHTDLLSATRADLVALRDARTAEVSASSWNNEVSILASFFSWARDTGLIDHDPIPRWGQRRRNTLTVRDVVERQARFLTEAQLRLFLERGLRADTDPTPPDTRERDYVFGLVLATMGLRREEAATLIDLEIPTAATMPTSGVRPFTLVGKGSRPRTVFTTAELVTAVDLYRTVERTRLIRSAQPALRRGLRNGTLLRCDDVTIKEDGTPIVHIGRRRVPAHRLTHTERLTAVTVSDRGDVEPLALFIGHRGTPVGLRRWNDIFTTAHTRTAATDSPDRPPAHLTVTPHILRHTYAVRMLSALMRIGRDRADDAYSLLANPVLTVKELLGHADISTTQRYLFAAERYTDELPKALREISAATLGGPHA